MQSILKVDLSTGESDEYRVPKDWERDFLGGASLAARILYEFISPEMDHFSPAAPLLFLTGPLTGTTGPAVGRFVVTGLGPLSGRWAESNCGGFWGPELRKAGFDGIWVTGRAEKPVYLWLRDRRLEIRDASHVWGQDTSKLQGTIREEVNDPAARVLGIGLAGENRVRFASILCDHGRLAGRTGLGAVMGSKNLKAIAVRGRGDIPLAHPQGYASLRSEANKSLKSDNVARVLHELGTAGVAEYSEYLGSMPKNFYHKGIFESPERISGAAMSETILAGYSACHGCVIACGRVVKYGGDPRKRKGPEYETVAGLGPNLGIDDLETICRLAETCDRYGMDTISCSSTIALAFHLFERGVIDRMDTGGMELKWGDGETVSWLLHLTARREAFGSLIAEGSLLLARHFGAEEEAIQVNGMEVPNHDPRAVTGMALVYATSPRGACHNQSDYFFVDWGQAEASFGLGYFDRFAGAEKSANVARHQDWRTLNNALVMCLFSNISSEVCAGLINSACGLDWSVDDMMHCGERGWNLKRIINHRLGLTRQNDTLPKALLQPLPDGGTAGHVPDLAAMLEAYYEARGWDPSTGKPLPEKMNELGLGGMRDDIWRMNS
ncbi:MAG: aldehyde ferredoxin oxidoreductase family protein [Chloroflexi bacterium]|nr:aldehyde ferredoxin oxidoreductase family protein [Chloroflexota bacterium]